MSNETTGKGLFDTYPGLKFSGKHTESELRELIPNGFNYMHIGNTAIDSYVHGGPINHVNNVAYKPLEYLTNSESFRKNPMLFLFTDIETMGLDVKDEILEVSMKLCAWNAERKRFDMLEGIHLVSRLYIHLNEDTDLWCLENHSKTGLFRDMKNHGTTYNANKEAISGFLSDLMYVRESLEKIGISPNFYMAGSGVHFDYARLTLHYDIEHWNVLSYRLFDTTSFLLGHLAVGKGKNKDGLIAGKYVKRDIENVAAKYLGYYTSVGKEDDEKPADAMLHRSEFDVMVSILMATIHLRELGGDV